MQISLFVRPTNNLGLTIYSIITWASINIVVARLSHHIKKYVTMITTVRLKCMYIHRIRHHESNFFTAHLMWGIHSNWSQIQSSRKKNAINFFQLAYVHRTTAHWIGMLHMHAIYVTSGKWTLIIIAYDYRFAWKLAKCIKNNTKKKTKAKRKTRQTRGKNADIRAYM